MSILFKNVNLPEFCGYSGAVNLLVKDKIIASRDRYGRTPIIVGKSKNGYCVTFESSAYQNLGFKYVKDLGPGEIVEITNSNLTVLNEPYKEMKICSFLWAYYGYPTATYEGKNVELFRMNNGRVMAETEKAKGTLPEVDYINGVTDSGTPHAIGYSNASGIYNCNFQPKRERLWKQNCI